MDLVAPKEKIWRFQYTVASQDAKLAPVKVQIDLYKMLKDCPNKICAVFINLGGSAPAFAKHFAKTFINVL